MTETPAAVAPSLPSEIEMLTPLPGVSDVTRFRVDAWDDDHVFFSLSSTDDSQVELVVAQPWLFFPDYEPVVDDEWADMLGLQDVADVVVFVLLTMGQSPQDATANLVAPIVVHRQTGKAAQIVLANHSYSLRAPLHPRSDARPDDTGQSASPARPDRRADVTLVMTAAASDLDPTRLGSALVGIGDQTIQPKSVVFISDVEPEAAMRTRRAIVAAARTEWIAFVHSDDVLFPSHLQTMMLGVSASEDQADVVYSWPVMIDSDGTPLARQPRRDGREVFDRSLIRSRPDLVVTSLVRREIADRVLNDPDLDISDERAFYSALVESEARFRCTPRETFLRQERPRDAITSNPAADEHPTPADQAALTNSVPSARPGGTDKVVPW